MSCTIPGEQAAPSAAATPLRGDIPIVDQSGRPTPQLASMLNAIAGDRLRPVSLDKAIVDLATGHPTPEFAEYLDALFPTFGAEC